MQCLIQEIWIITYSGITIYNQCIEEKIDKILFGGFISAINLFLEEISGENCKWLVFGNSQMIILKNQDLSLFFVGRSNLKTKSKKVEKYLNDIKDKFVKCFEKQVKNFEGDTSIFKDIDKVINIKNDSANYLGIELDKKTSISVLDKL